jgi:DNA/RNA-binding domain of Phe-tRNA-synthetase-like protein
MRIDVAPHPSLDARAFVTELAAPLAASPSPDWLVALLSASAPSPLSPDERVRAQVRDLLRHGGYKPTGRGKPASEYLLRAAQEGGLRSINLAVDVCNAVSLHSGLPISVVDCDKLEPPLRIAFGASGDRYVFNAAGQEIDVAGLVCLFDCGGPCANAVKDAQRTKTAETTRSTLTVIWSARALGARTDTALAFYRGLLERAGARVRPVDLG